MCRRARFFCGSSGLSRSVCAGCERPTLWCVLDEATNSHTQGRREGVCSARTTTVNSPLKIAVLLGVVAVATWLGWTALRNSDAELVVGESVAVDLESLAQATFAKFVAAAPSVADCIGQVRLEAASELEDTARYDQQTNVVLVRVPATAANLEAALVHEFAHHLEIACRSHAELRPEFILAQRLPPDTEWFAGAAWQDRPSEQFAEATVEAVLGRRSRNKLLLRLTPEATVLVESWLGSES